MKFLRFATAALVALTLGSCAGGGNGEPLESSEGAVAGIREAAQDAGASQEQVEILADGEVTFEEYQGAVGRTMSCLRDAGIEVIGDTVSSSRGFPEVNYSFGGESPGRTSEQTLAIADECMVLHSRFVEAAYQMSPVAIEAMEAKFAPYRDTVISCIRENGGEVEDEAVREEIMIASFAVQERSGVDCIAESGYLGN